MAGLLRNLLLGLAAWLAASGLALAAESNPRSATDATVEKVLVLLRLPPAHYRANSGYGDSYSDTLGRNARRRVAARIAREQGLTLVTDWPISILGVDCYVMSVPAGQSADQLAARLSRDKRVAWAQPMNVFHAQATGPAYDDPLFVAQPATRVWRLAEMHQIATGRNVRVAVIDSMVDSAHPDLAGQVQVSRNFVEARGGAPEEHGTGVAGVIAARGNNGQGIVGVAPGARLMALRACWQVSTPAAVAWDTICDSLSLAIALDYAITHRAQVINLSLSGPADPLLGRLLDLALAQGITVVSAFDGALPGGGFPASHPGVVVAADDSTAAAAGGIYVAPGRGVPTTQPGGRWFLANGSSYAAAHVSGLFALLREGGSRKLGSPILVAHDRGGAIDAYATLRRVYGTCLNACAPATYMANTGR